MAIAEKNPDNRFRSGPTVWYKSGRERLAPVADVHGTVFEDRRFVRHVPETG
jgi:hypothetical protein